MEKKDYRPMWKDLGLNLEGHDQLLAVYSIAIGNHQIIKIAHLQSLQVLSSANSLTGFLAAQILLGVAGPNRKTVSEV